MVRVTSERLKIGKFWIVEIFWDEYKKHHQKGSQVVAELYPQRKRHSFSGYDREWNKDKLQHSTTGSPDVFILPWSCFKKEKQENEKQLRYS